MGINIIFVIHFHILAIFDHKVANGDTKNLINVNDLGRL